MCIKTPDIKMIRGLARHWARWQIIRPDWNLVRIPASPAYILGPGQPRINSDAPLATVVLTPIRTLLYIAT